MSVEGIGEALRKLRKQRDWSQRKTAERAGISYSNLSVYERGKSGMMVETLGLILDAMEFDLGDLAAAMGQTLQAQEVEAKLERLERIVASLATDEVLAQIEEENQLSEKQPAT